MNAKFIEMAELIVNDNQETIARTEVEICNIGCSWCTNCSGIVGG